MGYQECYKETNELAAERYELVAERIAEIAEAAQAPEPFAEYFRTNAGYLQSLRALYEKGKSGSLAARSMEECEADNEALYGEILPEAYGHSYANPAYAAARLGEMFGGALCLWRSTTALKAQQQMPCRRKKKCSRFCTGIFMIIGRFLTSGRCGVL